MLARLDKEIAPARASVDRPGSVLRIAGSADGALVERVRGIVDEMGYVAELLDAPPQPVSRWFGAAEIDELSREEAEVLADRWVREMEAERLIEGPGRLLAPLRAWLLDEFREAAKTGEVGEIRARAAVLRRELGAEEAVLVQRWLDAKLGHTH